jgi:hypothetical protein
MGRLRAKNGGQFHDELSTTIGCAEGRREGGVKNSRDATEIETACFQVSPWQVLKQMVSPDTRGKDRSPHPSGAGNRPDAELPEALVCNSGQ